MVRQLRTGKPVKIYLYGSCLADLVKQPRTRGNFLAYRVMATLPRVRGRVTTYYCFSQGSDQLFLKIRKIESKNQILDKKSDTFQKRK